MKEMELRKHTDCSICKKKVLHAGLPLFWVVKLERHGILMKSVHRQQALTDYIGGARLANVMGTNEDMTMQVMDPIELTVCEKCATEKQLFCLMQLTEYDPQKEKSVADLDPSEIAGKMTFDNGSEVVLTKDDDSKCGACQKDDCDNCVGDGYYCSCFHDGEKFKGSGVMFDEEGNAYPDKK